MRNIMILAAAGLLAACAGEKDSAVENAEALAPADAFIASLSSLCGKAFGGALVSTDEADADFASETLVMHVRECAPDEVRVPFHVGDDHSRTWVITRTEEGLRLKHDHRHEDGTEDAVTQYGGDSNLITDAMRVEFPVDAESIEVFNREGLTASVTNVWAFEVSDEMAAYELRRENRFLRVEFDLSQEVETPPAPWGAE